MAGHPRPWSFAITAGVVLLLTCACGHLSAPRLPPVHAIAPLTLDETDLGRPVDANFAPLPSERPLFPKRAIRRQTYPDLISHEFVRMTDARQLAAHSRVWYADADPSWANHRFASHRVHKVTRVVQVDTSRRMRRPPEGAAYVISAIHWGHLYEAVIHGDSKSFHLGLASQLGLLAADVASYAGAHGLELTVLGRGLTPAADQPIFVSAPGQMASHYTTLGPPVPIFVDYAPLQISDPSPIDWTPVLRAVVRLDTLEVHRKGGMLPMEWSFQLSCVAASSGDPPVAGGVERRVRNGELLALNYVAEFLVPPGERIDCQFTGTTGNDRSLDIAPLAIEVPPVVPTHTSTRPLHVQRTEGAPSYTVSGSVEFSP